jgi:transcriptional regulator with XRE-family HTH domain
MGRKSTRENKSVYQLSREEAGLSRAQASELMGFVSESRIEKFESGKSPVQPDEVLAMSRAYGQPSLCNRYCSRECPIGREYVPEIAMESLPQIALQMLATMNSLQSARDRLIEIAADGEISDKELVDFARIEQRVEQISVAADALRLWVENMVSSGEIDKERLNRARESAKRQEQ